MLGVKAAADKQGLKVSFIKGERRRTARVDYQYQNRFGQLWAKGCIASLLPIPSRTGDTNEPGGHSADDGKFLLRETEISSPFLVDFSHTASASSRLS